MQVRAMQGLLELLERARKVSEPFTNQFEAADPRERKALPQAFDGAPSEVLRVAKDLTREVPVGMLARICRAVSDLERERRELAGVPPAPPQWLLFDFLPAEAIGVQHGVPGSVVWGAIALWKLADFAALVEANESSPSPADVEAAAARLLSASRACIRGQHSFLNEDRRKAASERGRKAVTKRHRETEPHKAEAIRRGASAHAAGHSKSKAAEDIMDVLIKGVHPKTGEALYYRKETILTWLTNAGWTEDGWPDRPLVTT